MKIGEKMIAPFGFGLAGVLFIIAAVISASRGKGFNAAFFSVGILFLIMGVAMAKKTGGGDSTPSGS